MHSGRLPRTLPGIPAPAGLRGVRGTAGVPGRTAAGTRGRTAAGTPGDVTEGAPVTRTASDQLTRAAAPRHERLGRVTAYVAAGTLISRVTGLLRILAAVYALGYSSLSDAFNLANNTPNIVHDLVLGGILAATFVPVFVNRLNTRPETEAIDSISSIVTLSGGVLVVATVLFFIGAPFIIDLYTVGSHGPRIAAERQVATELLRWFTPQLLAYGAISLMTAVLSTVRRFTVPAFAPILNNVVAIAVLLEFAASTKVHTAGGVLGDHRLLVLLGLGTTLGVMAQAAVLVPSLLRCELPVRFRWRPDDPAVREVLRLSGWTFGFVIANQVAVFVVSALAVSIGAATRTATLTAYTYAFTFFQLPFGIIAVSVMATVTPALATRFSDGDLDGFAHQFGLGMRRMLAGIIPASVGYLLLAGPAMSLISFGAGGVNRSSGAQLTASLLALLALGLPGYCAYLLAIRAFQAMRDTKTPFMLYLLENGLNVGLAFAFRTSLEAKSLALSLTIAYTVAAVAALFALRIRVGGLGGWAVGRYALRTLLCSVVMAFAVAVALAGVGSDHGAGLLVRVVAGVVAGVVAFGAAAGLAATASGWQTSTKRRGRAGGGTDGRDQDRHRQRR